MKGRGYEPLQEEPSSLYWDEMYKHITDIQTCCAVFHLGERLAAERFEVILNHPNTPDDIAAFIHAALPDEKYHALGFKRLAGEQAILKMRLKHDEVIKLLVKK